VVETQLRGELAAAEGARGGVVVGLEPATIQTYQRVQKLRGSAVAEARDEFCLGCRTKLPPQQFMEVMGNNKLKACPHCHRILFYVRPEVAPAPAAAAGREPGTEAAPEAAAAETGPAA
jgi:predicted  nucleic acid-binding Zn-ribbon protein